MFNIGGQELVVIFLVALVVLGPQRLPDAAKQVGRVVREFQRISSGFQREMRDAFNDPITAATKERGSDVTAVAELPPIEPSEVSADAIGRDETEEE